jgi:hypothetical protein
MFPGARCLPNWSDASPSTAAFPTVWPTFSPRAPSRIWPSSNGNNCKHKNMVKYANIFSPKLPKIHLIRLPLCWLTWIRHSDRFGPTAMPLRVINENALTRKPHLVLTPFQG